MKPAPLSRLLSSAAVAVALLTATGCQPFRNAADRAQRNNMLKAIGIAYHNLNDAKERPPTGPDDLKPYLTDFPDAFTLLKSGDIVFQYNVPLRQIMVGDVGSAQTVLAYEKEVPTRGGLVLMADGATMSMSPEEFGKARLAGAANAKDK